MQSKMITLVKMSFMRVLIFCTLTLICGCANYNIPQEELAHVEVIDTPGWSADDLYDALTSWVNAYHDNVIKEITFTNINNHNFSVVFYYQIKGLNIVRESLSLECKNDRFRTRFENPKITNMVVNAPSKKTLEAYKSLYYVDSISEKNLMEIKAFRDDLLDEVIDYLNEYDTNW